VTVRGTLRTLTRESYDQVLRRLEGLARGVAAATGTEVDLEFRHVVPGVENDPAVTAAFVEAAGEVVGADHLDPIPLPSMGGEDFAAYLDHAPGCLLRLGVARPGQAAPPLHSSRFDIDERALVLGARILARGVVALAGAR
jgi:metal-dependent amidase/aminoacylase/carboxypeptidase family protein